MAKGSKPRTAHDLVEQLVRAASPDLLTWLGDHYGLAIYTASVVLGEAEAAKKKKASPFFPADPYYGQEARVTSWLWRHGNSEVPSAPVQIVKTPSEFPKRTYTYTVQGPGEAPYTIAGKAIRDLDDPKKPRGVFYDHLARVAPTPLDRALLVDAAFAAHGGWAARKDFI